MPLYLILCLALTSADQDALMPQLRVKGQTSQLIVDGKPTLLLAGELHNSSASGVAYMQKMWPKLQSLGLNAVLAPVSWELMEPEEGKFDFTCVDAMLELARKHDQRLVLLWFGSWKNGVSSYAPLWVLKDTKRFMRARGSSNQNMKDILSPLCAENLRADSAAFARLMKHLKEADGREHTVVLVQVENEIGIKPEMRDLSDEGNRAFAGQVPAELMRWLAEHKEALHGELLKRWNKSGCATEGTWAKVFGEGADAEEVFSAWHYARYVDQIAAAGQAEYALPMYANAWLAGDPGTYPSGGPVAHMHDVWRAAAPHIALLAPDIYVGQFKEACADYTRIGGPLFVPEASHDRDAAARAYWVLGSSQGIGFSPFGIESLSEDHPLVDSYRILRQLAPLIADAQGTHRMAAIYKQGGEELRPLEVGDYRVEARYESGLPADHPPIGGVILQSGPEEMIVAGYGFGCRFHAVSAKGQTCIGSVELGGFDKAGKWQSELRLNGDETGANWMVRIPPFTANEYLGNKRPMILRVQLYQVE